MASHVKREPSPPRDPEIEIVYDSGTELLLCPNCQHRFDHLNWIPKDLPCGHSMCLSCIQLVVCAKCRWAGKPDQFRTNQGLLVALTARNVAAAEGRKYADIEAKFQQLQSQFTTITMWCRHCDGVATRDCCWNNHSMVTYQAWFEQVLAELNAARPGLIKDSKQVLQRNLDLRDMYNNTLKFLSVLQLDVKSRIERLDKSEQYFLFRLSDFENMPAFPHQLDKLEETVNRMKHLLHGSRHWSQKVKCETESSPLTCLTDIKKQALERARSAGNAFSADEAELSASVLSVVEFLMLREQLTSSTSPPVLEPIDCDNPSPSSASSSAAAAAMDVERIRSTAPPKLPALKLSPTAVPGAVATSYWRCKQCDLNFQTRSTWQRHCKLHLKSSGDRTCCFCNKTYQSSDSCRRHVKNVHLEAAGLKCPKCQRIFSTKKSRDRHVDWVNCLKSAPSKA